MPLTEPRIPLEGSLIRQDDGSHLMTLKPGEGLRVEFAWTLEGERLPVGEPFVWEIEAGIKSEVVSDGHEWCLWQWHSPNDPDMVGANPPVILIIRDGLAYIHIYYEHSTPFDQTKKKEQDIAEGIPMKPGRLYHWHVEAKIAEDGFVKVRRDGVLLADYVGPVGYNTTGTLYAKAGIYKWKPYAWAGEIKALVRY